MTTRAKEIQREKHPVKKIGKILGPGFITGAADDDPSGIGTYSVAGATLGLATLVGLVIPFTGIRPMDALFFTSIFNGIAAPFLLVLIMLAARNKKVMGRQTIGPVLTALGWIVTIAMFLALAGLALTSLGS